MSEIKVVMKEFKVTAHQDFELSGQNGVRICYEVHLPATDIVEAYNKFRMLRPEISTILDVSEVKVDKIP